MTSANPPALDFAHSPINQSLTPERKIELFTQMVRIRRFEQAALKYYNGGKMAGFLHLYIGQEAVAVGTVVFCARSDKFNRMMKARRIWRIDYPWISSAQR